MSKGMTKKEYNKWISEEDRRQLKENREYARKHTPKRPKRKAGKLAQKRANIQTRLRQARTDRHMSSGWDKVPLLDGIPLEEWKQIAKHGKTKQERDEAQARINVYYIQETLCHFWVWNTDPNVEPSRRALDLSDIDPFEF